MVRKAVRAAQKFEGLLQNVDRMVDSITERSTSIAAEHASTTELVEQLRTILRESTEIGQQMKSFGTQAARLESLATNQLVAARQAFSDTEAIAAKSKEVQVEIDAGRDAFRKLAAVQQAALTQQLQEFKTKSDAAVAGFVTKSVTSLAAGDEELKRLVAQLEELEQQVEKAMERATGASLVQAFQRRQLDIIGARKFWGTALASCMVLLLTAIGYFIYTLQFVTEYDAAFYTRLSITIPLTWAVGFCGSRYARESKRAREFNESLPPSLQAS